MDYADVFFDKDHKIKVQVDPADLETPIIEARASTGIWRATRDDNREVLIMVDQIRALVPWKEADNAATFS